MGEIMADVISRMIPFLCLLYSLSMLIFMAELSNGQISIALFLFLSILGYLFIPVTYIIHKLFSKKIERDDSIEYKTHSLTFITDYDRANPMSSKDANLKFMERMEEAGKLDKQQAARQRMAISQGGRFGGIMSYGQMNRGMQSRAASNFGGFPPQPRGFYGRQAGGYAMGGYVNRGYQIGVMQRPNEERYMSRAVRSLGSLIFGQNRQNRATYGSNTAVVHPAPIFQQPQYIAPAYGQGTRSFAQ